MQKLEGPHRRHRHPVASTFRGSRVDLFGSGATIQSGKHACLPPEHRRGPRANGQMGHTTQIEQKGYMTMARRPMRGNLFPRSIQPSQCRSLSSPNGRTLVLLWISYPDIQDNSGEKISNEYTGNSMARTPVAITVGNRKTCTSRGKGRDLKEEGKKKQIGRRNNYQAPPTHSHTLVSCPPATSSMFVLTLTFPSTILSTLSQRRSFLAGYKDSPCMT